MAIDLTNKSEAGVDPLQVKDRRRFEDNGQPKPDTNVEKFELIPRHDLVLIRQVVREEVKTEGGVVAPGADFFLMKGDDKSQRGIVVAAGPKSDLQKDDFVLFTAFPMEIEGMRELLGDDHLKLVRDEEVYARVKRCPQ